jgi:hypothetical protein
MTDEQMKISIAESVGYKELFMDNGKSMIPQRWESPYDEFCYVAERLPDYFNDRNACAEFEKTLTDAEHDAYRAHIWEMTFMPRDCFSATARQRCLAFLKTKGILP